MMYVRVPTAFCSRLRASALLLSRLSLTLLQRLLAVAKFLAPPGLSVTAGAGIMLYR